MPLPLVLFRRNVHLLVAPALVLLLSACNDARAARTDVVPEAPRASEAAAAIREAGVARASSGEVASTLRWAGTVEWTRRGDSVNLSILEPWKGARAPLQYTLRAANTSVKNPAGTVVLPARRIACLSAAHTGFLDALGLSDRIVAVDARRHVHASRVRAAVKAGKIVEVGSGTSVNAERLLAVRPDLVLANVVTESEHAALERVRRAGIPVVVTSEWMERHPLARAEWVRVIGLLAGKEARADSLFDVVEAAYLRTAGHARREARKPAVLLGAPFRDQWFVPGGRSFMASLVRDAGGAYLWADDTTVGGVPLGFEAVLAHARDADVWLQPGDWRSLGDGMRQDPRFARFSAFSRGDVYNNDVRLHADGSNDFWESGVVRPDRVLADLVSIFHGNEDSLFYYRRLPVGNEK